MNETTETYEQMVDAETVLIQRIHTCEAYVDAVLEFADRHGKEHHPPTIEEIVTAVFAISRDLRTELLHIRLEKAVLSGKMRHQETRSIL